MAALRMVSSLIPQPKWFQVFQPIWGVNARPLLRARTAGSAATRANRERDMVRDEGAVQAAGRERTPGRRAVEDFICASVLRRERMEAEAGRGPWNLEAYGRASGLGAGSDDGRWSTERDGAGIVCGPQGGLARQSRPGS